MAIPVWPPLEAPGTVTCVGEHGGRERGADLQEKISICPRGIKVNRTSGTSRIFIFLNDKQPQVFKLRKMHHNFTPKPISFFRNPMYIFQLFSYYQREAQIRSAAKLALCLQQRSSQVVGKGAANNIWTVR